MSTDTNPTEEAGITLNYDRIRAPLFQNALRKLSTASGLPTRVAYHISRLTKTVSDELNTANDLFVKLAKDHAELTDKGEFVPNPDLGPGSFKIPEDKREAWDIASKEFYAHEVAIDIPRVYLDHIESVDLTPVDIDLLEPLLDFSEAPPIEQSRAERRRLQALDRKGAQGPAVVR